MDPVGVGWSDEVVVADTEEAVALNDAEFVGKTVVDEMDGTMDVSVGVGALGKGKSGILMQTPYRSAVPGGVRQKCPSGHSMPTMPPHFLRCSHSPS